MNETNRTAVAAYVAADRYLRGNLKGANTRPERARVLAERQINVLIDGLREGSVQSVQDICTRRVCEDSGRIRADRHRGS